MTINDIQIDLIRKPIRRLHLRVYPDGSVVATAPWMMPEGEIVEFVKSKWTWVLRARERVRQHPPKPLPDVSIEQARMLVAYLETHVERWRQIMGEAPVTWKIRNMKTQWGNCRARTRQLTFNLQLALVPDELRDYIIVHELSHLQVQNHGPLFKARESQFMPDWPQRRKALRQYEIQLRNNE